jgi:DNA gyrase subunit B
MIENYLEENPNDARIHCSKVILAAKRVTPLKAREMVQRKTVMGGGGLPGKLSIVQSKILQMRSVSCRGRFGRGTATGDRKFQAILPLRGKILNVEKAIP